MIVKNNSRQPAPIGRYVIPAEGTCEVPDDYTALWQPRAQGLRASKVLEFPYHPPKKEAPAEEVKEAPATDEEPTPPPVDTAVLVRESEVQPDDLTDLMHIGRSRARTLNNSGVTTFASVVELGVEGLDSLLQVDRGQAEEIVGDAKRRL